MKQILRSISALIMLLAVMTCCTPESIDLSGEWRFQIDRTDSGENQQWFVNDLEGSIQLPGSMASNDLGDEITLETQWVGGMRNPNWPTDPNYAPYHDPENVRLPYWLQPVKKYMGAAWYQKEIVIPRGWKSNTISIFLERVHWESVLWFDEHKIGMQNSLGTSHEYLIEELATPGKHLITIRVDNRTKDIDVGWDSHSISDHTQSNWNGIVGSMYIQPEHSLRLLPIKITPNISTKSVLISGSIHNAESSVVQAKLSGEITSMPAAPNTDSNTPTSSGTDKQKSIEVKSLDLNLQPGVNAFSFEQDLGDAARLWDEFDHNLYELELEVEAGKVEDEITETFGLRKIEANDQGIFVNDRPTFLRGTLECAIFPLTGYPSTDPEEWKRIMGVIKDHGLNHMRFHSWCPPEAAFIAADEMGVYLQVECSSWANSTSAIGNGQPIDQYIWDESKMIIEKYGNHPSFVMMAYGNEPAGTFQNKFLTEFVSYWKEHDPRRIYTSGAGWPRLAVNDYHNVPQPRIQGWGEQLRSIINAQPPSSAYDWSGRIPSQENPESFTDRIIPVVSHEIGQWCVYPNLKETVKYTGVLKAKNFEIFEESLAAHGLSHLADSFLIASGKLQALCYKADIEAALRTPRFGGFQLLDLHDFPGQGTALVGILDPFWEEKGYITPEEFREFCNTTVPLARLEKHVFVEGETMEVPVQIAHYYRTKDLRPKTQIRLKNQDGEVISLETLSEGAVKIGNENFVGTFSHQFEETGKARQLELEVSYGDFTNHWDLWVYPTYQATNPPSHQPTKLPGNQATKPPGNQPTKPPGNQPTKPPGNQATNPLIVSDLSDETLEFLNAGGSVLLSLGKGKVSAEMGGQVGVGFSSIFWNTAWTGGQKPHTLGILCNPEHPALAQFPTEFHSNWQWWDAMSEADAIYLENFDQPFQPIVRIIDDWVSNRSLALIFEAKVGQGKIVISGADLHSNLIDRPAARQLLTSLEAYMTTSNFDPESSLSIEELHGILKSVDE